MTDRQDADRQDAGRQDAGRQDSGRQDSGRQDSGRQDSGRQGRGGQDVGRQDVGRQGLGGQDVGRQDSGRQGRGGQDTDRQDRIQVRDEGRVRHVVMSRPEVRNALDPVMIAALTDAFVAAATAPARVVVLSGEGPTFSAGADLDYMRSMAGFAFEDNVEDAQRLAGLFSAIRDCPKPVVARVHGAAMGGGVGLVAASDIAVAADDTQFALSEARLGVVPAVISPFVVPRLGLSAARELFLTGERFDARHALEIALVSRVVPADELDDAVEERVEALVAAAPGAQAVVKQLLAVVAPWPDDVTAKTARIIAERRASDEGREGMAAFLERRRPEWNAPAAAPTMGTDTDEASEGAAT